MFTVLELMSNMFHSNLVINMIQISSFKYLLKGRKMIKKGKRLQIISLMILSKHFLSVNQFFIASGQLFPARLLNNPGKTLNSEQLSWKSLRKIHIKHGELFFSKNQNTMLCKIVSLSGHLLLVKFKFQGIGFNLTLVQF